MAASDRESASAHEGAPDFENTQVDDGGASLAPMPPSVRAPDTASAASRRAVFVPGRVDGDAEETLPPSEVVLQAVGANSSSAVSTSARAVAAVPVSSRREHARLRAAEFVTGGSEQRTAGDL